MTDQTEDEWEALCDFVRKRIEEARSLPTLVLAARQILTAAEYWDVRDCGEYQRGYADAMEDALRMISGVWRYHADYEGWADDDY
jgi:hypothetical protein